MTSLSDVCDDFCSARNISLQRTRYPQGEIYESQNSSPTVGYIVNGGLHIMDISKFVTLPDRVVMESAVQFKEIGYKFFGVRVTLVGAVITDYVDVLERQGTKALSAVRDAFADHLFEGSRKPFNYFTEHFIWHSPEDAAPLLAGFYPS